MISRAALLAAAGVALGAFGAHGLKATLQTSGRLSMWETAAHYHLLHAVALLALGVWMHADAQVAASRWVRSAGTLLTLGIVCFSGSLYALALGVPSRVLWPVTPLGGVCFIAGWSVLALGAWRLRSSR